MDFPKQFICATEEYAAYDRFVPAPYFRKVFTANAPDCRLRVTGLGFYRVWINGREITKGLLAPYISNPDDIIYFDDYDLSPYIIPDAENALGFQLGNGMLNATGGATWDLSLKMITRKEFPSYGALAALGETTVPEFFELPGDHYYSHNHHMYCDVKNWFVSAVAGLRYNPDGNDFGRVLVKPAFIKGLEFAEASYSSPFGEISVR